MRRKIGYILLAGSLLLGAACTIGPTLVKMDTDVSLSSGRDMVFKISNKGTSYTGVDPKNYIADDGTTINAVAKEFESRLSTWGTNATVTKEGVDTLRVSFRAQQNDATEYSYLEKYLPFSGGKLSVDASITTGKDYASLPGWSTLFDNQTARIEYITTSTGKLPVVVMPINTDSKAAGKDGDFAKLLTYCKDNSTEADEKTSTQASYCLVTFWANKQSGDSYATATATGTDADSNVTSRLFFAERQDYAWYDGDTTTEDDNYKEVQLIPSSAALQTGTYNKDKAGSAAKAAKLYVSMLNAKSYENIGPDGCDVTFAFEATVAPSAESMITYTDWGLTPYWGATLISSLIAFAIGCLMLVLFYGLGSLAIISNVALSILASLILFSYFNVQFGVGAIVGLVLVALEAAFGGSYYFSKIKEQLYLGRSLKKAHQEGVKRALWPTIDAGLIGIILGLCVYSFVPDVVGKVGLMLVFGSFFAAVFNLLLLRLEGWFLANDDTVEGQIAKVYNVDISKIPNAMKEEKPTYFGPFAEKNFQKPAKWVSIVMGVLALASIVGIGVFSTVTGNAYNVANSSSDTTEIYIEYRLPKDISDPSVNKLQSVDDLETNILYKVELDGKAFTSASFADVQMVNKSVDGQTVYTIHNSTDESDQTVTYFVVKMANYFDAKKSYALTFNGKTYTTLETAMIEAVETYVGNEHATTSVKNVVGVAGTPSMASLWLGLGVGLLADLVYMILRYRPSRGLAAGLLSFGSSLLVCGFFALTRLAVTPLVSAGAIAAGFLTLLYSLYILAKEKEIYKESRERDKDNLAFHTQCLLDASKQGAGDLVVMLLLSAFIAVFYYGFAPKAWDTIFLGVLVGIVVVAIVLLILLEPLSVMFAKFFTRFHFNFHIFKKKNTPDNTKKKSAEPEEAVFIGIND